MINCKICNIELNNERRIYCSNKCKFKDSEYNKSRVSPYKNNKLEKLKCKLCNWETKDVLNKSGSITAHLNIHNIKFDRESYINSFNIIKLDTPMYLNCPICDWNSIDINNKSGIFTRHIIEHHELNLDEFISKYKQYNNLWKTYKDKKKQEQFINSDVKHQIQCKICNKLFKKISNSHLISHGITPTEYKIKYNVYSTVSDYTSDLQSHITTKSNLEHGNFNLTGQEIPLALAGGMN